jgi:hypothetical protein
MIIIDQTCIGDEGLESYIGQNQNERRNRSQEENPNPLSLTFNERLELGCQMLEMCGDI